MCNDPLFSLQDKFWPEKMTSKLVIFFLLIKNQTFFNRHISNQTYFFVFLGPHRCSRTHYFLPLTIFLPFLTPETCFFLELCKHQICQIFILDNYQIMFNVFLRPPRCATTPFLVHWINFTHLKTFKTCVFLWVKKELYFKINLVFLD